MPNALGDRATDICEPLLAIADMAGGDWPTKARDALVELCAAGDVAEDCIGSKLLAAIREIFEAGKVDRISTKDLLAALIERDCDEPWADWWEADIAKGNTRGPAAKLARLLKPFGVVAGTIREENGSTAKGYKLASFEDAFSRYLSPCPSPESRPKVDTTSQPARIQALRAIYMTTQRKM
jgi:putative DNA primase/helicase